MFIAYTFNGRKELRSSARETREEAAQELFDAHAKLHKVETAVAVKTDEGTLVTYGKDIRSVSRLEAAKARACMHKCRACGGMFADGTHMRCEVADSYKDVDPLDIFRQRFANWSVVLVIHVNAFTRKIESGYIMRHGVKNGGLLSAAKVVAYLAVDETVPVEFLSV